MAADAERSGRTGEATVGQGTAAPEGPPEPGLKITHLLFLVPEAPRQGDEALQEALCDELELGEKPYRAWLDDARITTLALAGQDLTDPAVIATARARAWGGDLGKDVVTVQPFALPEGCGVAVARWSADRGLTLAETVIFMRRCRGAGEAELERLGRLDHRQPAGAALFEKAIGRHPSPRRAEEVRELALQALADRCQLPIPALAALSRGEDVEAGGVALPGRVLRVWALDKLADRALTGATRGFREYVKHARGLPALLGSPPGQQQGDLPVTRELQVRLAEKLLVLPEVGMGSLLLSSGAPVPYRRLAQLDLPVCRACADRAAAEQRRKARRTVRLAGSLAGAIPALIAAVLMALDRQRNKLEPAEVLAVALGLWLVIAVPVAFLTWLGTLVRRRDNPAGSEVARDVLIRNLHRLPRTHAWSWGEVLAMQRKSQLPV